MNGASTARVEDRRTLRFSSLKDVLDDAEYLASGDPPRASGNWTPAQIVWHVARLIDCSVEGFEIPKAPLPVRVLGRLLRRRVLATPLRAGLRLPAKFAFIAPPATADWEQAMDMLREAVAKAGSRRMTQRSPVLGRLSHAQWEQFHCRHAEMHFSFMHPA